MKKIGLGFRLLPLVCVGIMGAAEAASPARCSLAGPALPPSQSRNLICTNMGAGANFTSDGQVPDGYNFMVTDLLVNPDAGTDKQALTDVSVSVVSGTSRHYSIRLRGMNSATYSQHLNSPYLVLKPKQQLQVSSAWFSEQWVEVFASGLLVPIEPDAPLQKVFARVYFRGTANNWGTLAMTLVSNNVWSVDVNFSGLSTDRFKFDINGDWATNYGDTNKDGIAELSGSDIYWPAGSLAGTYRITINDQTKAYRITRL